ncbi:hypothetical protein BSKO_00958 [Bryopsis sp. KO-2023]|nr:hypothetical protein BSKO_00958 [Bryopsis sp. KO-2023]
MGKKAFVTVGTTKFEELITSIDSFDLGNALVEKGFTQLVVQKGNGQHDFTELLADNPQQSERRPNLKVECFDFLPSIREHMESSSLIICHAGAGSIFEGLHAGKDLVVVPNTRLMDNHQVELAAHLDHLGHLVCASPSTLVEAVNTMDERRNSRQPFRKGGPDQIVSRINEIMGIE